jgi:broad specificity phosphatase PhoE
MNTIRLIRHGEAAASWQQNPDPGLSEQGRVQAQSLADKLAATAPAIILSSPLRRAQETAAPLARACHLSVTIVDAFREIPTPPHIAIGNRLSWLQACAHKPWCDADPVVLAWRDNLTQAIFALQGDVVIFTHFMVMNAVLGQLRGEDTLVCYQPDYCSVLTLERLDGAWKVQSVGREAVRPVL